MNALDTLVADLGLDPSAESTPGGSESGVAPKQKISGKTKPRDAPTVTAKTKATAKAAAKATTKATAKATATRATAATTKATTSAPMKRPASSKSEPRKRPAVAPRVEAEEDTFEEEGGEEEFPRVKDAIDDVEVAEDEACDPGKARDRLKSRKFGQVFDSLPTAVQAEYKEAQR